MPAFEETAPRGVLDPVAARARFSLTFHQPVPELAHAIDRHWVVRWDLADEMPTRRRCCPIRA